MSHDSDSPSLQQRWKRNAQESVPTYLVPSLMGPNISERLADRFRRSFNEQRSQSGTQRTKRQASEPVDHVVAVMEDIRKEMHTLEVKIITEMLFSHIYSFFTFLYLEKAKRFRNENILKLSATHVVLDSC